MRLSCTSCQNKPDHLVDGIGLLCDNCYEDNNYCGCWVCLERDVPCQGDCEYGDEMCDGCRVFHEEADESEFEYKCSIGEL